MRREENRGGWRKGKASKRSEETLRGYRKKRKYWVSNIIFRWVTISEMWKKIMSSLREDVTFWTIANNS